jgi:sugar (pentulose or hexulose) kinase
MVVPVIAVFDVGKTNKKVFFFDEQYKIVLERSAQFDETIDEDGDPCEDINLLTSWIKDTIEEITKLDKFIIKGVNFSAYGASFVHLDEQGNPLTPIYNYLKPYPPHLHEQFYAKYGGELLVSKETASPVLGNLNSGMQLYRLKYEKPEIFSKIKVSLHLPQYLSFLISGKAYTDITSIGCHTGLWDYTANTYHRWVTEEGIEEKLAPINATDFASELKINGLTRYAGIGLHDSSAALIPFLASFQEPFMLLSTGTWCVSLNPFNQSPLTEGELKKDCLCYISYKGNPVKASRLFAGNEHEQQTKKIAEHFNKPADFYKKLKYNVESLNRLHKIQHEVNTTTQSGDLLASGFELRDLKTFSSAEDAYHQLISDLMKLQTQASKLVLENTDVKRIFVDGGFSKNPIYMQLLASAFPEMEVFAASVAQATSIGAALAIHKHWNSKSLPTNIIDLKFYSASELVL